LKLKDKVAIVTGASRGLGKAIAIGFAREGAAVVVAARTEVENPRLPGTIYKTAEEIQALGRRALPVKCDVIDEQSVNNMVQEAMNELGHVDILVNNAGVAFNAPVAEIPLKRWELVLKVNLTGTFLCVRAVLPKMMERRCGSIINISSPAADVRVPGPVFAGVAYAVAKAAVERFTTGLAAEASQYNIAVNCLKPAGVVDTEGMRFVAPEADKSEWESPDQMVRVAVFLASQDAKGVTATVATDQEYRVWHRLD
jgi:citronellol/citronellal dehydrogenase